MWGENLGEVGLWGRKFRGSGEVEGLLGRDFRGSWGVEGSLGENLGEVRR